jgi:RNA polymerase sigma factor (sigma-70 family)
MNEAPGFVEFCRSEYPRLVGSLGLFCGDREVAQELAHEALMRAYSDWKKVGRMGSPTGWVHTVGMNLARSYFRRKAAERRATERLKIHAVRARYRFDETESIAIRDALATLSERRRTALVLRYYVDLPIQEIAEAMHCSPSAVKSLIRGALEALRQTEGFAHLEEADNAV